jgi:hypothetical protein
MAITPAISILFGQCRGACAAWLEGQGEEAIKMIRLVNIAYNVRCDSCADVVGQRVQWIADKPTSRAAATSTEDCLCDDGIPDQAAVVEFTANLSADDGFFMKVKLREALQLRVLVY